MRNIHYCNKVSFYPIKNNYFQAACKTGLYHFTKPRLVDF